MDSSSSPLSPRWRGSYVLGSSTFSVYEEMARQLREDGWRRKAESAAVTADLILGDRFHIPYAQLRGERMALSSLFHGIRWVNYFEGSHHLTLKAAMVRLVKSADTRWPQYLPESYAIGGDQLRRSDERADLLSAVDADPSSIWIVKPSSGAKGRQILLLPATEVSAWVEALSSSGKAMYVAQRYVDRPLLLSHNRKFDLRVWVLLVSPYSIYVYAQASCRTASVPYDVSDLTNPHVHLTNHCLQEDAAQFGAYEEGNEMWLPQLQAYLTSIGKAPDTLTRVVLPQIAEVVTRTTLAIMPEILVPRTEAYRCFQLFGYDVILTLELEVKLLEINGSPGIAEHFLQPLVRSMRRLIGADLRNRASGANCGSSSPVMVSPASSCSSSGFPLAAEVTREWRLDDEGFVLLWRKGDAVPPGLMGVT